MAEKNPFDTRDASRSYAARLQTLADAWQKKWAGAYAHSQKLIKLWASGYYDDGKSDRWHLINYMNRGVSAVTSYLVEGNPNVLVEPLAPKLRPYAKAIQLILDFALEQNKFAEEVLIPGATASMFGDAIARTFFEYDRAVSVDGERIKVGTPRVALIEPCDYVGDPSAKVRRDFAFEGDVYRLPTEYAKDLFAKRTASGKNIADLISGDSELVSKFSAEEIVSGRFDWNRASLVECTTFIDIYNRREQTIDTIMPMGHTAKVLRTVEHKGPEGGPYDVLGYRYLPNVPISYPPAWDWHDIDVTTNLVARAAREQAESQKTVIGAEPIAKDAAQAVLNAKNMDVITVRNIDKVRTYNFGGVSAENFAWLQWAEAQFSKSGTAASDVVSGRGPSSPTLGQDQLVQANASRTINAFYNKFHSWMTSIIRKWSWAIMESPSTYFEVLDTVKVPGLGDWDYKVYYSKADKVAEFRDLVFKITPFSTQRSSPEQLYSRLMQVMTQWFLPTMQMRQAQGVGIDIEAADKTVADYAGLGSFPQWYRPVVPGLEPDVDFVMKATAKTGQMDDRFGAVEASRQGNLGQQQGRAGYAGESKKVENAEQ